MNGESRKWNKFNKFVIRRVKRSPKMFLRTR